MRTFIIIVAGLALLAICLGIGKMISGAGPPAMTTATVVFVILWFVAASVNMWAGVYRAGYSFREELPAARRGRGACEMGILLKRESVIDTDASDETRFAIRGSREQSSGTTRNDFKSP